MLRSLARWEKSPRELTGRGASAHYHGHRNTTGDTGDHFDPDLDAYQVLGVILAGVHGRLWLGFVPQDHEVSINFGYVRRHMQKAPGYM
jgi:hypothetical protein